MEPLIIGVCCVPNKSIAHELAKLVNAGLVIVEDLNKEDKITGVEYPYMYIDEMVSTIEFTKPEALDLPTPIASEDIAINKKRSEHLAKCQPWKRHKKGRGK